MCRFKYHFVCLVSYFALILPCSCCANFQDEPYSNNEAVQDHIDECLGIVYKMKNHEIETEQGLEYLEDMLELLKLVTFYCIED